MPINLIAVRQVFLTFLRLGFTSFGGPVAHVGFFRKELVERQNWVNDNQFSQLLAISQFLPGPASSQLGFSLGFLKAGWLGALAAFLAFTLPSVFILLAFAYFLPYLSGELGGLSGALLGQAGLQGLKLVAFAVVADAVLGMSQKLCSDVSRKAIAIISACILLLLEATVFQIVVVLFGALAGMLLIRQEAVANDSGLQVGYSSRSGLVLLVVFFILLAGLPLLADQSMLMALSDAFYRAGALVFGGGHVVLPLLEESVVGTGWVNQENFLAGYGASQAIPGPMFSFSAYLGGLIDTGYASWVGALIALVFMFLPGFILMLAVLPIWQSLSQNNLAIKAIAGINAAVVGLLAVALYDPVFVSGVASRLDLAIAVFGFAMLSIWKLSPVYVVIWCVSASMLATMI